MARVKKSREEVLAGIDPDIIAHAQRSVLDSYKGDDIPVKEIEPPSPASPTSGQTSSSAGGSWWSKGGLVTADHRKSKVISCKNC